MNPVVKASVGLAVTVALVTIVFYVVGLHENPIMGMLFLVVAIGLNIGAVVWALKQTAAENAYLKQLLNGALIGVLAGVIILATSFITQSYIFPNSLQEQRDATVSFLEGTGMPEAQMDAQIAKLDQMTPMSQAIQGMVGTFGTSLIVGAIAAIFLRKK